MKIGYRDGPGTIGRPQTVVTDTRGQFYVVSEEEKDRIKVFDGSGRYVNSIGRSGEGPGEFQSINSLAIGPGDTLHVFDARVGRYSVFSPAGEYVRSSMFPGSARYIGLLPDGRFVVSGRVTTRTEIGHPLHFLFPSGEITQSFGSREEVYLPEMFYTSQRLVTPDSAGGMWVSHYLKYALEHWNGEGEFTARMARVADWFPPQSSQISVTTDRPLHPTNEEIHLDGSGHLWVLVQVNPEGSEKALGARVGSSHGYFHRIEDNLRLLVDRELFKDRKMRRSIQGSTDSDTRLPLSGNGNLLSVEPGG